MTRIEALEVTVNAPIVSFRNPLYQGIQVGLPCPPPSTVGGMLAATAGAWDQVPENTRFAMTFTAQGSGTDLETYHPAATKAAYRNATIKDREFLTNVTLTVWLTTDLEMWESAMRVPVWPLRLGRSQDLATGRTRRVPLTHGGTGTQGHALIPHTTAPDPRTIHNGEQLQLPTATTLDRSRTTWDTYRYARTGTDATLTADYTTDAGQALILLPPVHPTHAAAKDPHV
ncbi:CRISPR-associated protein Cas5 [Streptomyces sp. SID8382]|uniref:CRISPR-associated protein Cas5 n=1 Tax=Streptomyces malaysiensis TaxID=92644 RepID=UPI000C2C4342|nr:CRISPR-associated protein Cas5 [Streptomyces sp. M56]AUA14984.1 CRISPR-associated protein (Cas_Cas5) [Streptomyces sp. M56]MYX54659.1 CRISPR-associated protein Cas5 [Streptomyces sp. SID8382]